MRLSKHNRKHKKQQFMAATVRRQFNCLLSLLDREELQGRDTLKKNALKYAWRARAASHECCSYSVFLLNHGDSSLCHPRLRYLHEEVHEKRSRDKVLPLPEEKPERAGV